MLTGWGNKYTRKHIQWKLENFLNSHIWSNLQDRFTCEFPKLMTPNKLIPKCLKGQMCQNTCVCCLFCELQFFMTFWEFDMSSGIKIFNLKEFHHVNRTFLRQVDFFDLWLIRRGSHVWATQTCPLACLGTSSPNFRLNNHFWGLSHVHELPDRRPTPKKHSFLCSWPYVS